MIVGSEMASFTAVGLLIDYLVGSMPAFTICLTLIGVVASFYQLMVMAKAISRSKEKGTGDSEATQS